MLRSVFTKSLREQRTSLAWWSAALVALVWATVLLYPAVQDLPDLDAFVEDAPEALIAIFGGGVDLDVTSAAGYLESQLFALLFPILFLVLAVGRGAGAIAGEEDRGTIELLLANPISRTRLVLEKLLALGAALLLVGVLVWTALWTSALAVGMEVGAGGLAAATANSLLLALAFGALALFLGSASGRPGLSIGIPAGLGAAMYLLDSLAPVADVLEPWQPLSLFSYYESHELLLGELAWRPLVLLAVSLLLGAASAAAFARRDVRI